MVMLLACFGVDALFRRLAVAFPASVACLVLAFAALLGCEAVVGGHGTRRLVGVVDVPVCAPAAPALCAVAVLTGWQAGWALRWINVFFTPAFVLLPLSPSIGAVEVLKIITVFGTSSPLPPVCLCWGSMAVSDAETQSSASSS